MRRFVVWAMVVLVLPTVAARAGSEFFTFLPTDERLQAGGEARLASTFEPSGSTWADGLDERSVFHAQLGWRGASGRWW